MKKITVDGKEVIEMPFLPHTIWEKVLHDIVPGEGSVAKICHICVFHDGTNSFDNCPRIDALVACLPLFAGHKGFMDPNDPRLEAVLVALVKERLAGEQI